LTLVVLAQQSRLTFGHAGAGNALLLAGTGAVTAVPLLLFGAAARRLPLTSIGLLQYLAPMLQFAVGVGLRHEPMPPARLLGFVLVWIALVVLTADALTRRRRTSGLTRAAEAVAA
jgi:chloramphenicol-sensitive protein RarD